MKNDLVFLRHIHDSIEKIERYLGSLNYEEFICDEMRLSAVVRELEVIGQAARHFGEDFKGMHAEIPWKKMIDMRNFLIHQYFGVSEKIVWDTCKEDLPGLKGKIFALLNREP